MIIAKVNRTDPEKVFINVTNVSASSITQGYAADFVMAGASFNGQNVVLASAVQVGFTGVANRDIASNAVGLVQCWGHADSVWISNVGTSITITKGDAMIGGVAGGVFSVVPTYLKSGFKYIVANTMPAAISNGLESYCSGFVRCM